MNWQVPRMWEDGDVWIIGGGPSVPKQFDVPDEIIQDVIAGNSPPSVYSPYMESIHNKHCIGINAAYLLGEWIDIVFFGDKGFFLQHQAQLAAFPGLKVSPISLANDLFWVKWTPRDNKHGRGISPSPYMVSWNGNSGAAAISTAVHTGAKRIILLGFDMTLGEQNNQHWHDVYNRGPVKTEKRMRRLPFHRHLRGFKEIAVDAKQMGVEILNACPHSMIEEFPKFSVKELLFDNS